MPPRSRAAAAAAVAKTLPLPLEGCTIAFSGRFTKYGHSQASLENLVTELGGKTMKSVAKDVTHLVCTEQDYNDTEGKVKVARKRDLPLVKPEWLLDCEKEQTFVKADEFLWTAAPAVAAGTATNGDKKRPIAVANTNGDGSEDEKPQAKKAKNGGKADSGGDDDDANEDKPQAKKAKANGKTATKVKSDAQQDGDEVTEASEKVVAEGQFIKNTSVAIPLDEHCHLVNCQVYVDPTSGMIYDASLNQSSTSNNHNKFYRLQASSIHYISEKN